MMIEEWFDTEIKWIQIKLLSSFPGIPPAVSFPVYVLMLSDLS